MSVVEKCTTFKIEWQVTNGNSKSHEIELEDGFKVCFGVKTVLFQHAIYLVSKSSQPSVFNISEVLFSTCASPDLRHRMNCVSVEGPNCVYSSELTEWKIPLTITCWVSLKLMESVTGYSYILGDTLQPEQLWMAAKSGRLTDIDIQVGQSSKTKVFTAHRAILTARSSVLAKSLERETTTSSMTIDEVQPNIFKHFLRFIYTGQLRASARPYIPELQMLADRFQMETLQKLCRHPAQEMNASELTSLILSINTPTTPALKGDPMSFFGTSGKRTTHFSPLLVRSDLHSTANVSGTLQTASKSIQKDSSSVQERVNNIFFTGSALTPASSGYSDLTFPKFNQPTGPLSFNFGNRTPSTIGASPVIPSQAPAKYFDIQQQGSSKFEKKCSTTASTPSATEIATRPSDVSANVTTNSTQTSMVQNSTSFSFKSKQPVEVDSVTLKAAVVTAAVSRLRMIFDELLGTVEAAVISDTTPSRSSFTVPPPSPESYPEQPKRFHLSPPKLKVAFTSADSKIESSDVKFTFPRITQEGRFGKVPLRSPPAIGLPWHPNNSAFGLANDVPSLNRSVDVDQISSRRNTFSPPVTNMDAAEMSPMNIERCTQTPEVVQAEHICPQATSSTGGENLQWNTLSAERVTETKTL